MRTSTWLNELSESPLLLDGSYGAQFLLRGFSQPAEVLNLQRPEVVEKLQRDYVNAGADLLLTNTFSANRWKLREMKLEAEAETINRRAVHIARQAAGDRARVLGDLSSTGVFPAPLSERSVDELAEVFREQAKWLLEEGVDGFIVETISDIKELKAAVWGIRSLSSQLPLVVQMTFEEDGRNTTGTSVEVFARIASQLEVDVIGINCTLGPEKMLPLLERLSTQTLLPLSVEPNAGKPVYQRGQLTYSLSPEAFGLYVEDWVSLGARIIGGCCGTGPEHIRVARQILSHLPMKQRKPPQKKLEAVLCSRTRMVPVRPFCMVGERINPASQPRFAQAISERDWEEVLSRASDQEAEGAHVLDVNLGVEKGLSEEHFQEVIRALDAADALPLSLDIQTNRLLEVALREYPGLPLLNSARVTPKSLENKIALLKKYGGMLVLLAMDRKVPETFHERVALLEKGLAVLEEAGISRERVLADPLMLSLGARNDPGVPLDVIDRLFSQGVQTIVGLSNLSFGLPHRERLHAAFLSQAVGQGLTAAIMNPAEPMTRQVLLGSLRLWGVEWDSSEVRLDQEEDPVVQDLIRGKAQALREWMQRKLAEYDPLEISQKLLGKAMEQVGALYGKGKIFLPQLLLASDTATPLFDELNRLSGKPAQSKGKVVLATVEGDVHDIGKKIVGTVLRSGGFEIVDLGKDVPAAQIVEKVQQVSPDILGLSAMMTTTIERVGEVTSLLKKQGCNVPVIAGGASMNAALAAEMGCTGYASNAAIALQSCNQWMEQGK
ncbi:MAG TPA: homocysteine S-methyltransferase family protein [Thermotogota bacterium]|nr:homocysteine S-methyltransferase family protein [Thermotogota bacterium]